MFQRTLPTICLVVLSSVVVFAVLKQSKDVFAPIVSALLLGIVLTPLSDLWDRLRIPSAVAAFISVLLALSTLLVLLLLVEPYVTQAIQKAPMIWDEMRGMIDELKRALRGIERMSQDVVDAIDPETNGARDTATGTLPSLSDALFYAPRFAAQLMIFVGTLYFFLVAQNSVYAWVSNVLGHFGDVDLQRAGKQVARYVLTISAINFGFGVLVSVAMHLIGMPSPVLWGVLAFTLNFIVYLGPIFLMGTLLVTGIVMFDGPASFLPAAVYFTMNMVEAQFVTPTLIGKSLSINPLLIFLSLVFWLWLWGPVGGIIAIPILIWCLTVLRGSKPQTISSGTPGRLYPASAAGPTE